MDSETIINLLLRQGVADATIKGILKNVHREKPMDVINYVYDLEQRTDIRICCFLILPLLHSVFS
ncbi:hypothetical protein DRO64_01295 [Candidatus Bathyarchaeota archaeon]|nr:MAG: hypothetical protein DRO64_01295 [Candidatus Bathyarchaeota archaeon]